MPGWSAFLDLNKEQLAVIAKVLGLNPPVVQLAPKVTRYGMLPAGMTRADVRALYAIDLPDKPDRVGIYLTDAQKKYLESVGMKPCDYVEVESIGLRYGIVVPPPLIKYGVPPPSKRGK